MLCLIREQVCSQHDATPHTFINQVLRLYELRVLESIQFLFDMGFVQKPKPNPSIAQLGHGDRLAEVHAIRMMLDKQVRLQLERDVLAVQELYQ